MRAPHAATDGYRVLPNIILFGVSSRFFFRLAGNVQA